MKSAFLVAILSISCAQAKPTTKPEAGAASDWKPSPAKHAQEKKPSCPSPGPECLKAHK